MNDFANKVIRNSFLLDERKETLRVMHQMQGDVSGKRNVSGEIER